MTIPLAINEAILEKTKHGGGRSKTNKDDVTLLCYE